MIPWAEIIQAGGSILSSLFDWIAALVAAGYSPEDAAEIVRRDIEDRRAQIAANRAAVDAALDEKHGTDPAVAVEPGTSPAQAAKLRVGLDVARAGRLIAGQLTRDDVKALLIAASPAVRAIIADELRAKSPPPCKGCGSPSCSDGACPVPATPPIAHDGLGAPPDNPFEPEPG